MGFSRALCSLCRIIRVIMLDELVDVNLGLVPRPEAFGKYAATPFNRFCGENLTAKWLIGPVSQPKRFLKAQHLWAESRLWSLFEVFKETPEDKWPTLITFEVRLASSWYFRSDYLDAWPEFLVRRVRNEFFLKRRKSASQMEQMFASIDC